MASETLSATPRGDTGKGVARKLRSAGQVPGVIYGHGRSPQPLVISAREFDRLVEKISLTNTVIELTLDGRTARTLIREVQRHPIKRDVLHVDFQELVAGEKVSVDVPLRFVGSPEGVRTSAGIFEEIMHQIHVWVDPANIPDHIDVDVNDLTIGHGLHVSDLQLPPGVEVLDDPEATVCTVTAPKAAVEEVPAEVAAVEVPAEPELIRKSKAEEEESES